MGDTPAKRSSKACTPTGTSALVRGLTFVLLVASGLMASLTVAVAFEADPILGSNPQTDLPYELHVTTWITAVDDGENAWDVDDLQRDFFRVSSSANDIFGTYIDGPGGKAADATWGCHDGPICEMRFDTAEAWYFGTGTSVPSGQIDFRSVAAHEFGHWHGLGHSTFNPDSDNGANTMQQGVGGVARRTIEQDDINGYWRMATDTPRLVSNKSFEYTSKHWTLAPNGGTVDYLTGTGTSTPWGQDYVRLTNGPFQTNVSIRQNIAQQGASQPGGGQYVTSQAHIRGFGSQAAVVVWNLTGGGATPHIQICNALGGWGVCNGSNTFQIPSNGNFEVYIEVYNTSGTPLDVDMVDLYF